MRCTVQWTKKWENKEICIAILWASLPVILFRNIEASKHNTKTKNGAVQGKSYRKPRWRNSYRTSQKVASKCCWTMSGGYRIYLDMSIIRRWFSKKFEEVDVVYSTIWSNIPFPEYVIHCQKQKPLHASIQPFYMIECFVSPVIEPYKLKDHTSDDSYIPAFTFASRSNEQPPFVLTNSDNPSGSGLHETPWLISIEKWDPPQKKNKYGLNWSRVFHTSAKLPQNPGFSKTNALQLTSQRRSGNDWKICSWDRGLDSPIRFWFVIEKNGSNCSPRQVGNRINDRFHRKSKAVLCLDRTADVYQTITGNTC